MGIVVTDYTKRIEDLQKKLDQMGQTGMSIPRKFSKGDMVTYNYLDSSFSGTIFSVIGYNDVTSNVVSVAGPTGAIYYLYEDNLTLHVPNIEPSGDVSSLIQAATYLWREVELTVDGRTIPIISSPGCNHKYVNVGFTSLKLACKFCGQDKPNV